MLKALSEAEEQLQAVFAAKPDVGEMSQSCCCRPPA